MKTRRKSFVIGDSGGGYWNADDQDWTARGRILEATEYKTRAEAEAVARRVTVETNAQGVEVMEKTLRRKGVDQQTEVLNLLSTGSKPYAQLGRTGSTGLQSVIRNLLNMNYIRDTGGFNYEITSAGKEFLDELNEMGKSHRNKSQGTIIVNGGPSRDRQFRQTAQSLDVKIISANDYGVGTRAGTKFTVEGDDLALDELASKFKSLRRKMWACGKSAWLLKSEGPVDEETQQYLEERGLDDVQLEDSPPPDEYQELPAEDEEPVEEEDDEEFKDYGQHVRVNIGGRSLTGTIVSMAGGGKVIVDVDGEGKLPVSLSDLTDDQGNPVKGIRQKGRNEDAYVEGSQARQNSQPESRNPYSDWQGMPAGAERDNRKVQFDQWAAGWRETQGKRLRRKQSGRCPECGQQNPMSAAFCQHCGASMTAKSEPGSAEWAEEERQEPEHKAAPKFRAGQNVLVSGEPATIIRSGTYSDTGGTHYTVRYSGGEQIDLIPEEEIEDDSFHRNGRKNAGSRTRRKSTSTALVEDLEGDYSQVMKDAQLQGFQVANGGRPDSLELTGDRDKLDAFLKQRFSGNGIDLFEKGINMQKADSPPSDDIDPEKACKILKDGAVNGEPLTEEQKGMFGAACARAHKNFKCCKGCRGKRKSICPGCVAVLRKGLVSKDAFKVGDRVKVKLAHGDEPGVVVSVEGSHVHVKFDDGQELTIDESFVHKSYRRKDLTPPPEEEGQHVGEEGPLGLKSLRKWIKAMEDDLAEMHETEQGDVMAAGEKALKILKGTMFKAYGEGEDPAIEKGDEPDELDTEPFEAGNATVSEGMETEEEETPAEKRMKKKRLTKAQGSVVKEAYEALEDMGDSTDLPKRYKGTCKHHAMALKGLTDETPQPVCMGMDDDDGEEMTYDQEKEIEMAMSKMLNEQARIDEALFRASGKRW